MKKFIFPLAGLLITLAAYSKVNSNCVVDHYEFLIILAIGMFFGVLLSFVFREIKNSTL